MPYQKQDYVDQKLGQFTEMILTHKIKTGDLKASLEKFKLSAPQSPVKRFSQPSSIQSDKQKVEMKEMPK